MPRGDVHCLGVLRRGTWSLVALLKALNRLGIREAFGWMFRRWAALNDDMGSRLSRIHDMPRLPPPVVRLGYTIHLNLHHLPMPC